MTPLKIVEFKPKRYFIVNFKDQIWSEHVGGFGYWWESNNSGYGTVFRSQGKAYRQAILLERAGFVGK